MSPLRRIREVTAKSVLNPSRISGVTYAINPYVGCQHACAYCLHPSSQILTNKGFVEIRQLENEPNPHSVVSHKGKWRTIERTYKHFYEGLVRRFNIRYFGELCITPNHRILAIKREKLICSMDGFSICYPNRKDKGTNQKSQCNLCNNQCEVTPKLIEASKLEPGDFLIVPIPQESNDVEQIRVGECLAEGRCSSLIINEAYGNIRFKRGKTRIPNAIRVNGEFLQLVGYYLSKGGVITSKDRPNTARLVFTFHEDEVQFIEQVFELIQRIFNFTPKIIAGSPKTTRIEAYSTILARFFETQFGDRSENMKMPNWFLYLPEKKQRELLKCMFRGDGSITEQKNRPTTFVTTSENIRDAVRIMLLRQKIPNGVSISRTGKKRKHPAYIIFPAETFRQKFVDLFDLKKTVKEGHNVYAGFTQDFIITTIKEIVDEVYSGLVYNLQVEEDRTFVANYVAVSNCYARFMSRYTGHQGEEWGTFVDAKVNAPRVLQQQLRRKRTLTKEPVLFSSVTDAYQPVERRFQITRRCLEVLVRRQFPISILTKSDLVSRDADLLGKGKENEVGMTIITLDEKVRRVFEQGAPSSERRLETLRNLSNQGIRTYAFVGPIIPYLSTPDLEELVRLLGESGVAYILFDRLNIKYGNRPIINQALQKYFQNEVQAITKALQPGSQYYEEIRGHITDLATHYDVKAEIIF